MNIFRRVKKRSFSLRLPHIPPLPRMYRACPCRYTPHIDKIRGNGPQTPGDPAKYHLIRRGVGRYVEHVDVAEGMGPHVDAGGRRAQGEKQERRIPVALPGNVHPPRKTDERSEKNDQDVPQKGVRRQKQALVVQPRGVKNHGQSAQEAEIMHKGA